MRAAMATAPGDIHVERRPPPPGELLVRIRGSGLSGCDLANEAARLTARREARKVYAKVGDR